MSDMGRETGRSVGRTDQRRAEREPMRTNPEVMGRIAAEAPSGPKGTLRVRPGEPRPAVTSFQELQAA